MFPPKTENLVFLGLRPARTSGGRFRDPLTVVWLAIEIRYYVVRGEPIVTIDRLVRPTDRYLVVEARLAETKVQIRPVRRQIRTVCSNLSSRQKFTRPHHDTCCRRLRIEPRLPQPQYEPMPGLKRDANRPGERTWRRFTRLRIAMRTGRERIDQ